MLHTDMLSVVAYDEVMKQERMIRWSRKQSALNRELLKREHAGWFS